jgi:hypothetical protein
MYPKLSQDEMAATVCELIGWVTPNGTVKRAQCLGLLRRLESEGLVTLPQKHKYQKKQIQTQGVPVIEGEDTSEITECGEISLEIARPGRDLQRWRSYVSKYHMLGDPKVHGSQLRYTILGGGRVLGCMLFSASSWGLAPREEWIGWTTEEKRANLQLIINNSRFLILPYVRVKNLASRALSSAAKQIQNDWLNIYWYAPVLIETFVDLSFFRGTVYKASNWVYLGETQGRGRNDRKFEYAQTRKAIYVYPLQRDFRAVLKGEKPCKAVNLDGE